MLQGLPERRLDCGSAFECLRSGLWPELGHQRPKCLTSVGASCAFAISPQTVTRVKQIMDGFLILVSKSRCVNGLGLVLKRSVLRVRPRSRVRRDESSTIAGENRGRGCTVRWAAAQRTAAKLSSLVYDFAGGRCPFFRILAPICGHNGSFQERSDLGSAEGTFKSRERRAGSRWNRADDGGSHASRQPVSPSAITESPTMAQ